MVVAGAGTGKTSVLTHRFAYLLDKKVFAPNDILCITFTNKAADEMRKRIHKLVGTTSQPQWILTYHALGLRILREDIGVLNRSINFSVLDEEDKLILIREIYKHYQLDYKVIRYKKAIEIISSIKTNDLDINNLSLTHAKMWDLHAPSELQMIKTFYREYQKRSVEQNLVDFDDLLILPNKILHVNNIIAKKWEQRFKYVMVDEFQDTNQLQFNLLQMLIGAHNNIFVVGDPDQTIYTWRGAYALVFDDFISIYKPKQKLILDINYRSTENILNVANALIANDDSRIRKDLQTTREENEKVLFYQAPSGFMESAFVIQQINNIIQQKKLQYKDIAILYRAKYQSRDVEQQLIKNNIPFYVHGDVQFYQRKEIRDIIAYLRLLVDENNELALKRIINVPSRMIGQTTIDNITKQASTNNQTFIQELKSSTNKNIITFLEMMEQLRIKTQGLSIVEKTRLVIKEINYYQYLQTLDVESNDRKENINELLEAMNEYETNTQNSDLGDYLNEISIYVDKEQNKKDINQVHLMTIHYAKGTEYPVVFIVGINEISQLNRQVNEQEERRILFVGITRAKLYLFLSCNTSISIMGHESYPSHFISEIGDHNFVNFKFHTRPKEDLPKAIVNHEPLPLDVGEVVEHVSLGKGVVVGIKGNLIDVMFKKPHGLKTIVNSKRYLNKPILKH